MQIPQGIFCPKCGGLHRKNRNAEGNIADSDHDCALPKDDASRHRCSSFETQWQIFQYICLHPCASIKQIMRHTNHNYKTVQLETVVLEEKKLIVYNLGERKAHEYFPLMHENDLHRYKLILEKPRTLEDIAKATGSVANDERKRLDELEARDILYSKTIDDLGTKRYYVTGRDYRLLLPKD